MFEKTLSVAHAYGSAAMRDHGCQYWTIVLVPVILLAAFLAPTLAAAADLPPTISGTPPLKVYVGSQYSFRPNAADPEGKTLSFSVSNKPGWASFSASTGRLSGTPQAVGLWTDIKIRVTDGTSTRSLPTFSIRAVSSSNHAPTISGTPQPTATVWVAYSFRPIARDLDSDPLVFSIVNRPSWASFNTRTGQLYGVPAASHAGMYSDIVIRVTDGSRTVTMPHFSIRVNSPPRISGSPPSQAIAGQFYGFRPTVSDADGDALTFSIQNRPLWASFNASTGRLFGTPQAVGSWTDIKIRVTDGTNTRSLPAFGISVMQPSNGEFTLWWTPPTENTDGSPLTNLAGYRIHYGSSAAMLTHSVQVTNPDLTSYTVKDLSAGVYYFAVSAFTSNDAESAISNILTGVVQ